MVLDEDSAFKDAVAVALDELGLTDTLTECMSTGGTEEERETIIAEAREGSEDGEHWARCVAKSVNQKREDYVREYARKIASALRDWKDGIQRVKIRYR